MHEEHIMRVITTSDYSEFCSWIEYMMKNNIRYNAKASMNKAGEYKCSMELIDYSKEEVEKIKNDIGFYFD